MELSYRFGVTVVLALEHGAVVRFVIHDRGRMVDEYLSVPEYFGPLPPGDALALRANPTVVSRLTGAEPSRVRAVARNAASPGELPPAERAVRAGRRRDGAAAVIVLYDAARCPYCARVRIVLAEKGIPYEPVEVDLSNRPAWIYEKNPTGKVPVLEEDTFVLPESAVIMEYLEERFPEPALLPADPAARALERLWVDRFDDELGDDYYAFRRGDENALAERLAGVRAAGATASRRSRISRGSSARGTCSASSCRRTSTSGSRSSRERPAVREELDVVAALVTSTPTSSRSGSATELTVLDVRRRRVRRDGRRRLRSAAGPHSGRAEHRGRRARALRDVEQVQELVGLPAGAEIVAYCHCGSRSALAVQILRAAGYDARNYAGSWHEWSRREDLPLET